MTALWSQGRWDVDAWPDIALVRLPVDGLALELLSYDSAQAAAWGQAAWGQAAWAVPVWHPISCLVTSAQWSWGADRSLGVLTIAAGGSLQLATYDPSGQLDPSNPNVSYARELMPGAYIRMLYAGAVVGVWTLDTIEYSNLEMTGSLAGTDAVGVLANVRVAVPQNPPTTLRALARALVALSGLRFVRVEADPPSGDPLVGLLEVPDDGEVGLWGAIAEASTDALHYAWVGPDLLIHFRSHGTPLDRNMTIGLNGIPVREIVSQSTGDGIYNDIRARGFTGLTYTVSDINSVQRFGRKIIDRTTRRVPDNVEWADRVLEDRAWASLEYLPRSIIPTTPAQLQQLTAMEGIELVRVRTDLTDPPIAVDMRAIGLQMEASPEGFAATILGYVSSREWNDSAVPPPAGSVTVPGVVGLSLTQAAANLAAGQLRCISAAVAAAQVPGIVIAQSAIPGALAAPWSLVYVQASAPDAGAYMVPSVVGALEADAVASIGASGLSAVVNVRARSEWPVGTVFAQGPQVPGAIAGVTAGELVQLSVSVGYDLEDRTVACGRMTWIAYDVAQLGYGAGANVDGPIGSTPLGAAPGGNVASEQLLYFDIAPAIVGAVGLERAILRLRTSTPGQTSGAWSQDPLIRVRRLTEGPWVEGTGTVLSTSAPTKWPGPNSTVAGEIAQGVIAVPDTICDIDVTAMVRTWLPPAAGGSGLPNHGLKLAAVYAAIAGDRIAFWSNNYADVTRRPQLVLTVRAT